MAVARAAAPRVRALLARAAILGRTKANNSNLGYGRRSSIICRMDEHATVGVIIQNVNYIAMGLVFVSLCHSLPYDLYMFTWLTCFQIPQFSGDTCGLQT